MNKPPHEYTIEKDGVGYMHNDDCRHPSHHKPSCPVRIFSRGWDVECTCWTVIDADLNTPIE